MDAYQLFIKIAVDRFHSNVETLENLPELQGLKNLEQVHASPDKSFASRYSRAYWDPAAMDFFEFSPAFRIAALDKFIPAVASARDAGLQDAHIPYRTEVIEAARAVYRSVERDLELLRGSGGVHSAAQPRVTRLLNVKVAPQEQAEADAAADATLSRYFRSRNLVSALGEVCHAAQRLAELSGALNYRDRLDGKTPALGVSEAEVKFSEIRRTKMGSRGPLAENPEVKERLQAKAADPLTL